MYNLYIIFCFSCYLKFKFTALWMFIILNKQSSRQQLPWCCLVSINSGDLPDKWLWIKWERFKETRRESIHSHSILLTSGAQLVLTIWVSMCWICLQYKNSYILCWVSKKLAILSMATGFRYNSTWVCTLNKVVCK